jgi:hypothetical protein
MQTSSEDLDRFINSLGDELGGGVAILLSAQDEERHHLDAASLAHFAATLFGYFAAGFVAGLTKQAASAGKELGKKLGSKLADALGKLRDPDKASPAERQQALASVDESLRAAANDPAFRAGREQGVNDGKAALVAQFVALGMERAEAEDKADVLARLILARAQAS